jgi:O-succinylbenzoic acid--CoA ligase
MLVPEWLAWRAQTTPDRLALVWRDRVWSFASLAAAADEAARRLAGLGVRMGDRVAVVMVNRPEFVQLVHAVSRLGAILVPLNVRLTGSELRTLLDDAEPRVVVVDRATCSLLDGWSGTCLLYTSDAADEAFVGSVRCV